MIAPLTKTSCRTTPHWHEVFLRMLPVIQQCASITFIEGMELPVVNAM